MKYFCDIILILLLYFDNIRARTGEYDQNTASRRRKQERYIYVYTEAGVPAGLGKKEFAKRYTGLLTTG